MGQQGVNSVGILHKVEKTNQLLSGASEMQTYLTQLIANDVVPRFQHIEDEPRIALFSQYVAGLGESKKELHDT